MKNTKQQERPERMTPKKTEYVCIHEDQIQDHSVQIKGLETRADFKDKRIDELNNKMDKMEEKLDDISKNVNQLILQSSQQDNQLEIRLTKIETDMANQKQEAERKTVWIGIGLTILTILINIYFQMIH